MKPKVKVTTFGQSLRGFAAMSPSLQRKIARKGGLAVSRNRRHMSRIGKIGGQHSHNRY